MIHPGMCAFESLIYIFFEDICLDIQATVKTIKVNPDKGVGYGVSVAFSPDRKRIITGSTDNTAKIWNAQTGKELLTLKGHTSSVCFVAFSDDGRKIITKSATGIEKIWDSMQTDSLTNL